MPRAQPIYIRAGDTEPIDMDVSATGLDSLEAAASIKAFFRLKGSSELHVDGGDCTVVDPDELTGDDEGALRVRFDPVDQKNPTGNAFDEPGTYEGHLKVTWDDGDITRYPGNKDMDVLIIVGDARE